MWQQVSAKLTNIKYKNPFSYQVVTCGQMDEQTDMVMLTNSFLLLFIANTPKVY
jgi:hypothetical protein